jgi:tetratricopeptide (TPR) repeat protein
MQKASSLNPPTVREQLLIEATAAFFHEPESGDYWRRIRAWADGMEKCYNAFPADHEVAALYALSLVATVPPDQITSPNNDRAAEILLGILKENPNHPGAMHYLIHANDTPGREHESLDFLSKYEAIAPNNPHALHMPTHIHTRLGNWPEVIRGNIRAAEAALNFPAGDHGVFVWDEFPHAIEYLVYAYLQRGEDDSAAAQLKRLHGTPRLEPTFKTAFHLASTQARYALERRAWNEAAAIAPRSSNQVDWDKFPWPEAISWFARGLGSVHTGNAAEARASRDRLVELEERSRNAKEELFMRNIRVLRLGLSAWVTYMEGTQDSSVRLMTLAAELETSTPKHAVTPGPILPAYELLGDILFEQGRNLDAHTAYKHSLEHYPLRFNSLLGAARASAAEDDIPSAKQHYEQLLKIAGDGSQREAIREAKSYLSR